MPANFLIPQTRIDNLVANLKTLQDNIDAIQEDLNDLHQTITQEIGQAITNLQGLISDEETRATGVEGQLRTDLTAETNRATTAEGTLQSAINSEVTARQTADTTLQENITAEVTRATGVEGQLRTDLTAETNRATTAEGKKVDKVSTANSAYGTDSTGAQTSYDKNSFGKVDDVKVGTKSVVSNKIATLGTMAGETASNYATVTALNNKIKKVTSLPSTQETGVLYCIPE